MKLKTLGSSPMDMDLYKLYTQYEDSGKYHCHNIEDIFNFWEKYRTIILIKRRETRKPSSIFESEFIDIYTNMLLNILHDCCVLSPRADNSKPVLKHQWLSKSYQYDKFFKYVVDILITDMKSNLFRKILIIKNMYEFDKFIDSRLYMLGYKDNFEYFEYDEDYVDYFLSKDCVWQKNDSENRNRFEKIEQELLEELK